MKNYNSENGKKVNAERPALKGANHPDSGGYAERAAENRVVRGDGTVVVNNGELPPAYRTLEES